MVKGAARHPAHHRRTECRPSRPPRRPPDTASPHAMAAPSTSTLGEMFVKADKTTVKAGEVMFDVTEHRRHDARPGDRQGPGFRKGGMLEESTLLAKGKDLAGGEGGDMVTADLKPGSYELVCFIAGHYAAGQRSDLNGHRMRTTIHHKGRSHDVDHRSRARPDRGSHRHLPRRGGPCVRRAADRGAGSRSRPRAGAGAGQGRGVRPLPHRHPRRQRGLAREALAAVRPRPRERRHRRRARPGRDRGGSRRSRRDAVARLCLRHL